jgi:hypothetical protein
MGRIRFTAEQIIGKLREAEVLLGQGMSIGEAIRRPPASITLQSRHLFLATFEFLCLAVLR